MPKKKAVSKPKVVVKPKPKYPSKKTNKAIGGIVCCKKKKTRKV